MNECRCGHPAEDHVTGLCLSTLDCLCRGYAPRTSWTGPGESDEGWAWVPEDTESAEEDAP